MELKCEPEDGFCGVSPGFIEMLRQVAISRDLAWSIGLHFDLPGDDEGESDRGIGPVQGVFIAFGDDFSGNLETVLRPIRIVVSGSARRGFRNLFARVGNKIFESCEKSHAPVLSIKGLDSSCIQQQRRTLLK